MGRWFRITAVAVVSVGLLLASHGSVYASVMGIDYGTEFFKVALVAPKRSLDIVLNRDYKRKSQAIVVVDDSERLFGVDAASKHVRLADKSYPQIKSILGRPFADPACVIYQDRFANRLAEDPDRGTPLFLREDQVAFTPQEILAMQLQYARETASTEAGHNVTRAVITVPPFFDQFERQAVLDAASLVGVDVLSLITDGASVAMSYAMDKQFPEPRTILFYDVGAGSTKATLATFGPGAKGEGTLVTIEGYGYDRTLGGIELDFRLQRHLGQRFMTQFKGKVNTDIFDSPRARMKLLKEANRVKHILNANTEAYSSVENLFEGHDFRTTISREEFESLATDLMDRLTPPIDAALRQAGKTLDQVDAVVVVGGSVRVPFIEKRLLEHLGSVKVSKNLNADEAAVKGATFYAANMSLQLRTKGIVLKDITTMPVQAEMTATQNPPTLLFPAGVEIPSRKAISYRRDQDFDVVLSYPADVVTNPALAALSQTTIKGVAAAMGKYEPAELGSGTPKVRVSVQTDGNGLVSVVKAEVTFNVTNPAPASTTAGTESTANDTEALSASTSSAAADATATPQEPYRLVKVALVTDSQSLGVPSLTTEQKSAARTRFTAMDAVDLQRREHAEAVNGLEAYVYFVRDFVDDEGYHTYATSEDRALLLDAANAYAEWLDDQGESTETKYYVEKYQHLKNLAGAIQQRHTEHQERPELVTRLQALLADGEALVAKLAAEYSEEELRWARKDMDSLQKTAASTGKWLADILQKQDALPLVEDPVLLVRDLGNHVATVEKLIKKVTGRKIKKRPASTSTTSTESTTTSDETTETTPAAHDEL
ncbi:lumenal Hsp70 protein [Dimargaris verticillata]|uniref:Lumenal Hsp70 protein n=1 Tax=Dimargaris verticillata TaxID=2761393 RepID=A0A9W8EFY5_9FUNG|nr:lumenal Hsp70 protein [Dimargaris verticillata]